MKTKSSHSPYSFKRQFLATWVALSVLAGLTAQGAPIKWGLNLVTINNPITPSVVTNGDGSITITGGGGDTYDPPDSFTFAYQQVTGDFDISVQVMNVTGTDTGEGSLKGALMMRASLDPVSLNVQISALPAAPFPRDAQIESIGRMIGTGTDDLPGRGNVYGGDTTDAQYASYPDCWLRIQRQGEKVMTYFKTTNTTDIPSNTSPLSTNGWQLLTVTKTGTNFPKTVYFGLSTVAHNGDINDTTKIVAATYANYGPTPTPASTPSEAGVAVASINTPGSFPNTQVLAANFDVSVSADGLGYPGDIVQSSQGAAAPIIWNSGGFSSVSRDVIASISGQTPGGFCLGRYQAGAFDFMLNPKNPVTALQNLGPYTNPLRQRIGTGTITTPSSQAWAPSPNYGFVFATVRKNGQQWNDTAPAFYATAYVQLDDVATGRGYDMIGGHFRGAQFYTRTTKPVTGSPLDPLSDPNNLQRCAIPISLGWFPYDQGWKAGYFNPPALDAPVSHWKRGNGFGLNSGTAVIGLLQGSGQDNYNSPSNLLTWVDTTGGGTYSGLAVLSLPGVHSVNDGMLFTIGNNEAGSKRGPLVNNAPLPDGSGWDVAVRDVETSKADPQVYATGTGADCDSSFSFVYIPYNADNLIGGHIRTNGTTLHGAGTFTVTRLSTGRYALTIPGKTGNDGALLLQTAGYLANQPGGFTNVVDTSFLSYEYGGTNTPANAFIIEARYVDMTGGGEGVVALRDAEFNFVFVDFTNPVAPPGTTPPVLTITKSGGNATVSWTKGPGFILQKTTSLAAPVAWTDVGPANPSLPIPIAGSPQFFRVRSP